MDETDLMKVRMCIAEARAASTGRHADFMAEYGDIAMQMAEFYRTFVPAGTPLPQELTKRIADFHERGT